MNRNYAIVDDFLSLQEHLALWSAFQQALASAGSTREWNRVYGIADAPDTIASGPRKRILRDDTAGGRAGPPELHALSEKLFALTICDPPIAMKPWTAFSQSAWTYRPGAGLEWHSDAAYLAGYIYYMHPRWKSSWGGELLVANGDEAKHRGGPRAALETVCQNGGVFIYPRPNRLVLLKSGVWHCIKKVESAAGQSVRASIAGFFFGLDNAS